jgi:hypothetical protein
MSEKEVKRTNYPDQVASFITGKYSLAFTADLHTSDGTSSSTRKPVPPFEVPGYSVFRVAVIDSAKNVLTGNIPENDIISICDNIPLSRIAAMNSKPKDPTTPEKLVEPGEEIDMSIAGKRFRMGALKGKSILEVMNDPALGREALEKNKIFLSKNVEKFPANQQYIDAIDYVLMLSFIKPEAKSETSMPISVDTEYVLYNSGIKHLKEVSSGFYFCYQIVMRRNFLKKLPYEIVVTNFEAPVVFKSDGRELITMSSARNRKEITVTIPDADFGEMMTTMNEFRKFYRNSVFASQLALAEEIKKKNIEETSKEA